MKGSTRVPRPTPRRSTTKRSTDFLARITGKLNRLLSKPISLLLIVTAVLLYYSESKTPTDSLFDKAVKKIGSNAITDYAKAHTYETIAFIGYVGAAIASPPSKQLFNVLIAAALAYLIPESTKWEYIVQGVLFYLFVTLPRLIDKTIVSSIAILSYSAGWAFSKLS